MPFSRKIEATALPIGSQLTADMVGVGMLFAAEASEEPNIEDTLLAASIEGLESDDLRVLAVLTTWIEVHHSRIHADRLLRSLKTQPSPRVLAYWASIGSWLGKDRRLARLTAVYSGRRIDLLRVGTSFQLLRQGEDSRFQRTRMRVPAGILRDRQSDVLSPVELARRHRTYRCRIQMGPSFRADMWAAIENDPHLSAAQLARLTYGSFATAWKVKQDWVLLESARG
jgi:hypothetical protein